MATLGIVEFSGGTAAGMNAALGRRIAKQTVTIGGASAPSSPFNEATRLIRVHVDLAASIDIGANGSTVATPGDWRHAANQTEYYHVKPGDVVAVIASP